MQELRDELQQEEIEAKNRKQEKAKLLKELNQKKMIKKFEEESRLFRI